MRKWMVVAMAAAVLLVLTPAVVLASGPWIYGEVQYSASHTGNVVVCALKEGEESPTACGLIPGPGDFSLGPLPAGKYYVCAFVDLEGDAVGPPNADEPQGCSALVDLTQGSVDGVVVVMQDPEPEFVPEPGSILLLGSGLAGLAGYASLRWRKRQ